MSKAKTNRVKFSGKRTAGTKAKTGKKSGSSSSGGGKKGSNAWRSYTGGDNSPIPF